MCQHREKIRIRKEWIDGADPDERPGIDLARGVECYSEDIWNPAIRVHEMHEFYQVVVSALFHPPAVHRVILVVAILEDSMRTSGIVVDHPEHAQTRPPLVVTEADRGEI